MRMAKRLISRYSSLIETVLLVRKKGGGLVDILVTMPQKLILEFIRRR